jgi:Predicted membrane protein
MVIFKESLKKYGVWSVPAIIFIYGFIQYRSVRYLILSLLLFTLSICLVRFQSVLPRLLYVAMAVSAGLVLTIVAVLKYVRVGALGDVDMACYTNAFWNLAHGHIYQPLFHANMFSGHSNYLSALFIPLFVIAGNTGLILGQAFLCFLSAFLIIRGLSIDTARKMLYTMAILLTPGIAAIILYGFHPDCLGGPLVVLALLAYKKDQFKLFLLACALLLLTKEVFIFAISGMVLLSLIEKKHWKWTIVTGAIGAGFMGIYWFVLTPFFAHGQNFYINFLPPSLSQWLILICRPESLLFIAVSLFPYLLLTMPGNLRYLLLPLPVLLFYAGLPDQSFREFWRHYSFTAAILSSGILIFIPPRKLSSLAAVFLLSIVLLYPSWKPLQYVPSAQGRLGPIVKELHRILPGDGMLMVHGPFLSHFASRKSIVNWVYTDQPVAQTDFILIDSLFMPSWLNKGKELKDLLLQLHGDPNWKTIYFKDCVYLFSRNSISK